MTSRYVRRIEADPVRTPTSAGPAAGRGLSPLGDIAAIYVQRGASAGKQTTACLQYAQAEHLPMRTIVPYYAMDQAVQMVRERIVNVIIVAFDSRVARQLAVAVCEYGGHVVYTHPSPGTIHPPRSSSLPDMDALILRWWDAGRTAHEIAQDIGGETTDVAAVLRKGGRGISRPD